MSRILQLAVSDAQEAAALTLMAQRDEADAGIAHWLAALPIEHARSLADHADVLAGHVRLNKEAMLGFGTLAWALIEQCGSPEAAQAAVDAAVRKPKTAADELKAANVVMTMLAQASLYLGKPSEAELRGGQLIIDWVKEEHDVDRA